MRARIFLVITGILVLYQLLIPPIVGLADQGDFLRLTGKFGYEQDPPIPYLKYVYLPLKFVPSSVRVRDWEQPTSESLFVAAALLVNKVLSKNGSLAIGVVGATHAIIFLLIYSRFLQATKTVRSSWLLWAGATFILTDVGYVAYWNSLYREPASLLFGLLLITETIVLCRTEHPEPLLIGRWILWAALLLAVKEQNTTLAPLFAIYLLRARSRTPGKLQRWMPLAGLSVIFAVSMLNIFTSPRPEHDAAAYNVLFLAIVPESRTPSADLAEFGLSPRVATYSGTNRWSENTGFNDPEIQAAIGARLSPLTTAEFFCGTLSGFCTTSSCSRRL